MYLFIFFVLYFLLTFVWRSVLVYRRTGINPFVLPGRDDAYGYVGRAFKMVMGCVAVLVALHAFVPLALKNMGNIDALSHEYIATTGWILMVLSLIWIVLAQSQMGNSWRVGIDEVCKTELVMSGLFSISRNPIFLGMRVTMLGLFFVMPSALTLTFGVAAEILIQIQVRLEEAHLQYENPERYIAYSSRVRRWF
jgi:protein-S-isoprenylcysteine O-methyltransferase Ste14